MITVVADPLEGFLINKFPFLDNENPKTGGHRAVRESLLDGLSSLKIPFVYNPYNFRQLTSKVIVIASPQALQQLVEYKQSSRSKFSLAAGPNIVVSPEERGGYLGYPEVDFCVVPSGWVKDYYIERLPALQGRVITWPAGVDVEMWKPETGYENWSVNQSKKMIFYLKRPIYSEIQYYKEIAERHGWEVEILKYRTYNLYQYKEILKTAKFLVHFVEQESQGISMLESWSMNIPTLVWNPGYFQYREVNYKSSSAPYMIQSCGSFFRDTESFENLLKANINYNPREWVVGNATKEISTMDLLQKLNWL